MSKEHQKKIKEIQEYLIERKKSIFYSLKSYEQKLENLSNGISELQTYIEIEKRKEKQESNIFTLYPTTQKYEEEKKKLNKKLEQSESEKEQIEETFWNLKNEFDTIEKHIITSQIIIEQLEEKESKSDAKVSLTNTELMEKLKFCLEIIELDKERCAMELRNIISDLDTISEE